MSHPINSFLNSCTSPYHAVKAIESRLQGYTKLDLRNHWSLEKGGKYYLTVNDSTLLAFRMPATTPTGFMLAAAHTDSPTFKLKPNCALSDGVYRKIDVEPYGGVNLPSWMDRPLSAAGRIMVQTDNGIQTKLVSLNEDILVIPSMPIHLYPEINSGYTLKQHIDMVPIFGTVKETGELMEVLAESANVRMNQIISHDLYLYVRQEAVLAGSSNKLLIAPRLDDLSSVYCLMDGFLNAGDSSAVPVLCAFDNEECGSSTRQGAASLLLRDVLQRIADSTDSSQDTLTRLLWNSFLVSSDNAHALHPNHPELFDKVNAPVLGGGVVIKTNANQRYATDACSYAIFDRICNTAGAAVQCYANRSDLRGGTTLGALTGVLVTVPVADVGLPQLAMHSCVETAHIDDVDALCKAMKVYYSSALVSEDGACTIKLN